MSARLTSFYGFLFIFLFVIPTQALALDVGGVLTQNTTWTVANSPINLSKNLLVSQGITLKIDPGVTVNFNGFLLQVDGYLTAQGTASINVVFHGGGGELIYLSNSVSYDPNVGQGLKFQYLASDLLSITAFGTTLVENCKIQRSSMRFCRGESLVKDSIFIGDGSGYAIGKSWAGPGGPSYVTISGNYITGYDTGINIAGFAEDIIEHNIIQNNLTGVYCSARGIVRYNSIIDNNYGLRVGYYSGTINNNNIYGNRTYDLYVQEGEGYVVNALNNYWGIIDLTLISTHIYDFDDDFRLAKVTYDPILSSWETRAPNPLPKIRTLSPSNIEAGSTSFALNVIGSGFVESSVVNWNGNPKVTAFISPTQITASIPASDITVHGTANITVFNPYPGGGTSNVVELIVNPIGSPLPTLISLSPTSAEMGGPPFTLTVNGTGFISTSKVRWNGSERSTTYISSTQLTASISATDIASIGTASITVSNPSPGGGTSNSLGFGVTGPNPTLTSISPTQVEAGSNAFSLTVNGTNFLSTSIVRWNSSARTTHYLSATQLTADITANDVSLGGAFPILVVNPDGQVTNSKSLQVISCSNSITPQSESFNASGGIGSVNVVGAYDCGWKASSPVAWITIQSGSSGWGNGAVSYIVAANTGGQRQATLAIAGKPFTVTQSDANCSFTLDPTAKNFTSTGGSGSVAIQASGTNCQWQAASSTGWITITGGSSGSGNGTVNYTVASNTSSQRQGTITIGGQTHTITQDGATVCTAQRTLPTYYAPGQAFQVTIQVTPPSTAQTQAIEDQPPTGWTVSAISTGGNWDNVNKKAKWGPFLDNQSRTLQYTVTPPAGTTGTKSFTGSVAFDMTVSAICGSISISMGDLHPADSNSDWRLSVEELTAYGSCWKTGCTWGTTPTNIPINYVTNASLIWKNGEAYHFDSTKTPPACWIPGATNGQGSGSDLAASPLKTGSPFQAARTGPAGRQQARTPGQVSNIGTGMRTSQASSGSAVSTFSPTTYTPGTGIVVSISVTPGSSSQVYAVEDLPPTGWTVTDINNSGSWDGIAKKVKFGPFFDNTARTLSYTATPPAGEAGEKTFSGVASFDGSNVIIGGTRTINTCCANTALAVGLGRFGTNGGWVTTHANKDGGYAIQSWIHLPWEAYNATGGGIHLAMGDVDGDGLDEYVLGLGTGGGGWIAVLDDSSHQNALLKRIQIEWGTYNTGNGEVFPAVGDLDGDGKAEIVAGLGTGSQGWIEIFGNASTGYRHLEWRQVSWPNYNAANGTVHPAIGDLDGDGKSEFILGLANGSGGWIEVLQSAAGNYAHQSWIQVHWPAYNSANGTTWPSAGDIDGDGRAEIVAGLGQGSQGWVEFLDDQVASHASLKWFRIPWDAYNTANGETHPAVGNLDSDSRSETVFGLGRFAGNGGWLFTLDDAISGYASLGWFQIPSNAFSQEGEKHFLRCRH